MGWEAQGGDPDNKEIGPTCSEMGWFAFSHEGTLALLPSQKADLLYPLHSNLTGTIV